MLCRLVQYDPWLILSAGATFHILAPSRIFGLLMPWLLWDSVWLELWNIWSTGIRHQGLDPESYAIRFWFLFYLECSYLQMKRKYLCPLSTSLSGHTAHFWQSPQISETNFQERQRLAEKGKRTKIISSAIHWCKKTPKTFYWQERKV